jgi:RES domain-containing protein
LSVTVWRIGVDTPSYEADDLSGEGAKRTGGRWNEHGHPLVYTSETRALACLETLVHLNAGGLPLNRYLVRITIPDNIWAAGRTMTPKTLPVGWDAEPAGRTSIRFGDAWINSAASALMRVPSVIVPEEYNVLFNPLHPDGRAITALKLRRWSYDPRLSIRPTARVTKPKGATPV